MQNIKVALAHGLNESEYLAIVSKLGREPNITEIGILAAMWSEHCSYKSSKVHLKKLPTKGERVLQGPGENAGIVDIGDDLCVVFKMESHNHPSYIEPYQGAATGVGGILRDIFTMGARPIALLDSLRFGDPKLQNTRYLLDGVVSGIAGYGNCIGIPTVGGEVYFDECYNGNPIVNVFAVGITKKDEIFKGAAKGVGNPVIYVGSKTGRDGIHGAVMASETFTKEAEEKRPTVQVGDPFTEKLLLEACLELFKTGIVIGIQDMGAAGLTSSSTEMASRAGTGIKIFIEKIPKREEKMTPYEVMLSESQERMLIVTEKGNENIAEAIFKKWGLDFSVIGEVTGSNRLEIVENGVGVADIPISLITMEAPVYSRPYKKPAYLKDSVKLKLSSIPVPKDLGSVVLELLSSPTLSNKKWIFEQYDHMVRTNTITPPGSDSALIRIKGTRTAIALTTNCNSRYCYLDPYVGAMIAVAESARNLSCSGAIPLAISDCLNFGNPENPEIMWQFVKSVEGLAEAANFLGTPIVSGNVSFYNETGARAIYPTPSVAMVGLIEDAENHVTQWFKNEGDIIVILGKTREELGGSQYLSQIHGLINGNPPEVDLEAESNLVRTLIEASKNGIIKSSHDLSEGGLAIALAESCFTPSGPIGVKIKIDNNHHMRPDAILFSESQSRALVSLDGTDLPNLERICQTYRVPMELIGEVRGDRFVIDGLLDIHILDAHRAWDNGLEDLFKSYA
jgi:phosphoribosylformylglycinamidine synthase II